MDDEEELMQTMLGFCNCGRPDLSLRYIRDALRLIPVEKPKASDWEKLDESMAAFFGSQGAMFFFLYWADKQGLAEHDGSVTYGWLEQKGEELLSDLEEMDLDEESETQKRTKTITRQHDPRTTGTTPDRWSWPACQCTCHARHTDRPPSVGRDIRTGPSRRWPGRDGCSRHRTVSAGGISPDDGATARQTWSVRAVGICEAR